MKLPIKTKTDDFVVDIIGMDESQGVWYIRFEDSGTKKYLGSIDKSDSKKSLILIRDALNDMIEGSV